MIRVLNSHFKFCHYCRWVFMQLVTRPRMSIGPCSSSGNIAKFSLHCQSLSGGGVHRVTNWDGSGASQSEKIFYCIQGFSCCACRTTQALVRQLLRRLSRNYFPAAWFQSRRIFPTSRVTMGNQRHMQGRCLQYLHLICMANLDTRAWPDIPCTRE